MTTLRFHNDLYSRAAVDEAVEVFADHATIERRANDPYVEVEITAAESEPEVAGEFGNYVLALTIDRNRA